MSKRPITVFTAGGFDCYHTGHQRLLERARALGDKLIVAINHDRYLARKGPGRPIDSVLIRTEKLYATGLVDAVHLIGDSPLELILDLKPDIIVAGSDYTLQTCVGSAECAKWGGVVQILARTPGISTSDIVKEAAAIDAESDHIDRILQGPICVPHDNDALTEGSS